MTHTLPLPLSRRFATLLQREWLQHHRAWMILSAVTPLAMLALLSLGRMDMTFDDGDAQRELSSLPAVAVALLTIVTAAIGSFVLAWMSSLLQAPGLARRDIGDRSIEFWLSMPVGHTPALAAPLLTHLLLFPLGALALGTAIGLAMSPLSVARFASLGDWLSLPWGLLLGASISLVLRIALGLVLATLWLSPLILMAMAASAWLKRWGLPALVAGLVVLGGLLDKLYGNPVITALGERLFTLAGRSFLTGRAPAGVRLTPDGDPGAALAAMPAALWADAGHAVAALADPLLALALAVAAGCFGLLVLRRRQGN
jgi:ABC-2 type transport system permease protein